MQSPALNKKIEKKLLHYTGKAIHDFNMISKGDRVLVCLSGGKDSHTLLKLMKLLKMRSHNKFEYHAFTLDQGQPGYCDQDLKQYLTKNHFPHTILREDTYSIVTDKIPENKTYCGLCSRLRRGIIYRYARENGYNKVALGHHRDDLIQSLLMSAMYNGEIRSMPPKLLTDDKSLIVIRPMVYCQESDIIQYSKFNEFPIIPCNLCGNQENLVRKKVGKLIKDLALINPKVPSNLLHSLQSIKASQLMDQKLWDFKGLEQHMDGIINDKVPEHTG